MRPHGIIARAYLARGTSLWIATRAVTSAVLLLARADPIRPLFPLIVLLSILACVIETRRRREGALLGNLGVRPAWLMTFFAGPAVVGELAIRVGFSVLS